MPATVRRVKEVLYIAGMALAVAGIALDDRRIVWVAIGLLVVGVIIRLVIRRAGAEPGADQPGA